jgi:nitroreductase
MTQRCMTWKKPSPSAGRPGCSCGTSRYPREPVNEAPQLAMRAPSNSNVQPWHVVFTSGPARDRLVETLLEEAHAAPPKVPELPESFAHLRRERGATVYGAMGISRHDAEARRIAVLRN